MNAAVFSKLKFLKASDESWNVGGGFDFYDYLNKCGEIFDSEKDILTDEDIEEYRKAETISRENGCPKYLGIISFDNDFLRENGFMLGDIPDIIKLKDVTRKAINEMIETSRKLDASNCYWTAGIHTDTDNIHIQFALLEYEKRPRKFDKLEPEARLKLRSVVANTIDKQGRQMRRDLTDYERRILQLSVSDSFRSSEAKIRDIIGKLPQDCGWQYGRLRKYQNEIDSCIRSVISEDPELTKMYKEYIDRLDKIQNRFRMLYGRGSKYTNYKVSRLNGRDGFFSRVGNDFLKICKEYKSGGGLSEKEKQIGSLHGTEDIYPLEGEAGLSENENAADVYPDFDFDTEFEQSEENSAGLSEKENRAGGDPDIDFETQSEQSAEKGAGLSEEKNRMDTACYRTGLKYLQSGDIDKAVEYLKVSANDFNNPYAQYRLGKIYLGKGKNVYAEKYFKMAAENGNTAGQVAYGLILRKRGETALGNKQIQKAADGGDEIAKAIMKNISKSYRASFKADLSASAAVQISSMKHIASAVKRALGEELMKTARLKKLFERNEHMRQAMKNTNADDEYIRKRY